MKRHARLRPRGIASLDGAAQRQTRPDDESEQAARGASYDPHPAAAELACVVDQRGVRAGCVTSSAPIDPVAVGGASSAVDPATAAYVARSAGRAPDHRRELRALRTARARRLAIALALARGARLE